jgi:hypothetical protein
MWVLVVPKLGLVRECGCPEVWLILPSCGRRSMAAGLALSLYLYSSGSSSNTVLVLVCLELQAYSRKVV